MRLSVKKYPKSECFYCSRSIEKSIDGYFSPSGAGSGLAHLVQVCAECFRNEEAINEADCMGWRYTLVGVGTKEYECYCGPRCPCGAAIHHDLGWCIKCWKESRMLSREEAEVNLNKRLIKQIKEHVKKCQSIQLAN